MRNKLLLHNCYNLFCCVKTTVKMSSPEFNLIRSKPGFANDEEQWVGQKQLGSKTLSEADPNGLLLPLEVMLTVLSSGWARLCRLVRQTRPNHTKNHGTYGRQGS